MKRLPATARRALALAAAALCASVPALAETSPFTLGANQRFERLDNLFNLPTDEQSDTRSTTTLRLGLSQPLGRQRLFADLSGSAVRFSDNDQLNHTGYSTRIGMDWETVGNLSGSLSASANQSMSDFSPAGLAPSQERNLSKSQRFNASARLGGVTRMTGELAFSHASARNSSVLRQAGDNDVNEVSLGLRYRPGASLTLGAALRGGQGKYPRYPGATADTTISEGFKRRYVDLTADWPLSGASVLNARLSLGKETYDTAKVRDFSGVTGALGWRWQPTGKVSLSTNLSRETGDRSALFLAEPGASTTVVTVNRVSNSLSLTAGYEVTAKINLSLGISASNASVVNPTAGTTGDERSNTLRLGLKWQPTRSIGVGCDWSRNSRDASLLASAYDSNVFGCYGDFTLQ